MSEDVINSLVFTAQKAVALQPSLDQFCSIIVRSNNIQLKKQNFCKLTNTLARFCTLRTCTFRTATMFGRQTQKPDECCLAHVCKNEERYHPHPTPTHPTQQKTSYAVASTTCASARNILCLKHRKCVQVRGTLPSPPHPNPSHPTKNIIWRSIDHVGKCKKRPMFEASKMCASTRNVAIPTPPQPIPPNKKHHMA